MVSVDVRHLRHFLALVEEGSFTRAARREFIVQSGLSSSIRALEDDLGVDLYVKGTRPLRLTAEGRALVPAAREAVRSLDAVRAVVSDVGERLAGRLSVGVFTHVEHLLPLAKVLSRLAGTHPALELRLTQLATEEMARLVAGGGLDCAILSASEAVQRELDVTRLAGESFVLTGHRTHRLGRASVVTVADLAGERFVEMPRHLAVRRQLDRLFQEAGVRRRQVGEVDDWGLARDLVAHDAGLAFLPHAVAAQGRGDPEALLWYRTLDDVVIERRIDLALPRGHAASPAARALRTALLATLA